MASTKNSYRPRNIGTSVIHCDRVGEDGGCWGTVRMTGHGYRCEGHRKASGYIEEPKPLTAAEIAEIRRQAEEKKAKEKAEWEAKRWFRGHEHSVEEHPFVQGLSLPVLAAVFSMLGEGIRVGGGNERVTAAIWNLARPTITEVKRRRFEWPVGYYELRLAPEWDGFGSRFSASTVTGTHSYYNPFDEDTLAMDLSLLDDRDLMVLYGCATQVVDYSCLERGARQVGEHIWHETEAELKRRGIKPEFLMDWEGR